MKYEREEVHFNKYRDEHFAKNGRNPRIYQSYKEGFRVGEQVARQSFFDSFAKGMAEIETAKKEKSAINELISDLSMSLHGLIKYEDEYIRRMQLLDLIARANVVLKRD